MGTLCMDPATAKLAVELQLADIDYLLDGLYDVDELPEGDERTGFQILRNHLESELQMLETQTLALQILKEDQDNRAALSKLLEDERQLASDHQLAMQLAGMTVTDPNVKGWADYEASLGDEAHCCDDEQWELAKELYAAAFEPVVSAQPSLLESQSTRAERMFDYKALNLKNSSKCSACMEQVPRSNALTLACQPEVHTYCRRCLIDLFTSALVNTTLFPPRCCKIAIPLETCRAMLPKDLIKEFDLKVEELATPNPTYCANGECSKFIQTRHIKADVGTCVYCKDKTCIRCKCAEHDGLCPSDPHVQLLMDAAKRAKWQQCTKCKNMVELDTGCFHMQCRCLHEFCYLCGMQWKTCACPQWEEDYLTRRFGIAPVARRRYPAPAPVVSPVHVHFGWRRIPESTCEECRYNKLEFVMRCAGCNFKSCWRCIHNRG